MHRGRYDDWTFPKGKNDPGEPDEACAVREVLEETGLRCRLGAELPSTTYVDAGGRRKLVRYWVMSIVDDVGWSPDDEIDAHLWLPIEAARRHLSYDRDRSVLDALGS